MTYPAALMRIQGQDNVRDFFARALASGRLSQAYLFVGVPGAGKHVAAEALAECLVCSQQGCDACDECIRVRHHTHPDVHIVSPASASGYLVEQIRTLIEDVNMAPIRAARKVYIIDRADLLQDAGANALLKTIEEPPEDVVFILLARNVDSVLPTIVSRCQLIPFRVVSSDAALTMTQRLSGADENEARLALGITSSPEAAAEFLASNDRKAVRALVVRTLIELPHDDGADIVQAAREIVKAVGAPLEALAAEAEEEDENVKDYLSSSAQKKRQEARKREMSARERSGMMEALACIESVLRDALIARLDGTEPLVNSDVPELIDRLSLSADSQLIAALECVWQAREYISYNVSPQLSLEVMLLGIKEAL